MITDSKKSEQTNNKKDLDSVNKSSKSVLRTG